MRRTTGAAAFAIPIVAFALGPWFALVRSPQALPVVARAASYTIEPAVLRQPGAPYLLPAPRRSIRNGGCGCRTIVVDADNLVREAKVRSGDARSKNYNVTYISSAWAHTGHARVRIVQRAFAVSGDAIAGQLIGVAGTAPGCVNILIRASNNVADSKVRSGDAIAENRNYVFLDPDVNRDDVKIDVVQSAHAQSGIALAGQVIGALNRGGGPCRGRVIVEASNTVTDTKVQTGDVSELNKNIVTNCKKPGCASEMRRLLGFVSVPVVQMCSAAGCAFVDTRVVVAALRAQGDDPLAAPTPTPTASGEPAVTEPPPTPTPSPKKPRHTEPTVEPDPTPGAG